MNFEDEHAVLYQALESVTEVLKDKQIPYYLIGGSAIGAVRDNEIIPWDDDIDLGIERKYFSYALKCIKEHVQSSGLRVYEPSLDTSFDLTFAKVVNSVPGQELIDRETGIVGAYIDIFPLDHTAQNIQLRRLHQFLFRGGHALTVAKNRPSKLGSRWGRLGGYLIKKSVGAMSYRNVYRIRDVFILFGKFFSHSSVLYNFGTPYENDREIYFQSEIADKKLFLFGDSFQPVPIGYDSILSRTYGDYMKPPKNTKQKHLSKLQI